jgi:pyruvate/2-oxoglutarate dehydrogenase complex dihydrolipoamide acyltransferase (E2) component
MASKQTRSPGRGKGFSIQPRDKYLEAADRIIRYEIRPANCLTFISEVDLSSLERARAAAGETRPSYTAFVVRAVALALREMPYVNTRICRRVWLPWQGPRLQKFTGIDVAVAAEREVEGTTSISFIDVVRDADTLSLAEITDWLRRLAASGADTNKQWHDFQFIISKLPRWLSTLLIRMPFYFPSAWTRYRGGAAWVSSPAKYGVDTIVATWPGPLGVSFGMVKERPIARNGEVVVVPTFNLVVVFDRRIMAGAQAARFHARVAELLSDAENSLTGPAGGGTE